MIGCLLTGHGNFGKGLYHSLEMIAGPQENFEVISFLEELPLEEYGATINESVKRLAEKTDGVIVFSDLLGGTPFKTAMMAAYQMANVAVIAGTNLPVLVESSVLRLMATDAKQLANNLIETGRDGLQVVELSLADTIVDDQEMEGI